MPFGQRAEGFDEGLREGTDAAFQLQRFDHHRRHVAFPQLPLEALDVPLHASELPLDCHHVLHGASAVEQLAQPVAARAEGTEPRLRVGQAVEEAHEV